MELAKDIFKFDSGPFNWYIIRQDGRLTLVDAGFPSHYKIFAEGLRSIGHTIKDVEAVILTHAHADHIGFAERIRKQIGVPVFIHSDDAQMACRPLQLPWFGLLSNAWRPYIATMLGVATINGVFSMARLEMVKTFKSGETLDVPGRPLALHTPGHTRGESVFYLQNRGVLFSGDTMVTRDLMTGEMGGPQITHPLLNYDYKQSQHSLDLMRQFGNVTMLPGHGKPWIGNISDAIKMALDNVISRANRTSKVQ